MAADSLRELCAGLYTARQSVSKHLAVLEAANLVTTVWHGREKLHYLNAEPINATADSWIKQYERARGQTLVDLKSVLEGESMSGSAEFVYTTYINTTPERLWQAITDQVFSERRSKVSFDLEPQGDQVKLTRKHPAEAHLRGLAAEALRPEKRTRTAASVKPLRFFVHCRRHPVPLFRSCS